MNKKATSFINQLEGGFLAMTRCPKCGESISDKSSKCIHCGYVLPREEISTNFPKIMIGLLVVIVAIAIIGIFPVFSIIILFGGLVIALMI